MMNEAHDYLKNARGLRFYRMMGSGQKGFSPWSNLSVYALLMVWDSEDQAEQFVRSSELFRLFRSNTSSCYTLYLSAIRSRGSWSGEHPFVASENELPSGGKIVVLTRATIKWSKLIKFWRYVPTAQSGLEDNPELIFTIGIGEVPLVQMCTLSIWKSKEGLEAFAYNQRGHQGAIARTKTLDWYKEELFARFVALKSEGQWEGKDLLDQ